jgi:ribonuclease R
MAAERDTTDRYLAAFLSDRVGRGVRRRISGIARFGAFVKLDETGADGLVPISELGHEYFHYDRDDRSGLTLGLGTPVTVRLTEAVPVTGGLLLELVSVDGAAMPAGGASGPRHRRHGHPAGGGPAGRKRPPRRGPPRNRSRKPRPGKV